MQLPGLIGVCIPAALLVLVVLLTWEREVQFGFKRDTTPTGSDGPIDAASFTRSTLHIHSQGERLEAWLYLPKGKQLQQGGDKQHSITTGSRPPPIMIMGHGLGMQKDIQMHVLAESFVKAGIACLLFDFRGFGGSDGEPRYWADAKRHFQDWWATVQFVKNGGLQGRVDEERVILFGISYSGALSLETASKMGHNVTAVVAVVPYVDSREAYKALFRKNPPLRIIRLLLAGASDLLRQWLRMPRVYMTMMGRDEDFAIGHMSDEGEYETLMEHIPKKRLGGWSNKLTPSSGVNIMMYNPKKFFPHVQVPVLFVAGTTDYLTPVKYLKEAQALFQTNLTEYVEINAAHLGAVVHPDLPPAVIKFVQKHV